jgi:1D-myo-inositol 3-kinase
MATPDFLVVGHVTRDLLADGTSRLGGTAFYAAVTADRLGCRVAVYTAAGPELDWNPLQRAAGEATVVCRPAAASTTFHNRYQGGAREQFLFNRAAPLLPEELPVEWQAAPVVLLGPVAQEVTPAWVDLFPRSTVGACLQGWLRGWDEAGRVGFAPWEEAAPWLARFSAAFMSVEDVAGQRSWAERYADHCPLLIMTEGARGATLYDQHQATPIAPFPVQEVDPTGAGDVFAAAFLLRLAEGAAPPEAARFAAAAAALSVQGWGVEAIRPRPAVESLLQEARGVVVPA